MAEVTLQDVQLIAISEGFSYPDVDGPVAKKANLQGSWCSAWQAQTAKDEKYWGQTVAGTRQGFGVLLYKAGHATARYCGQFEGGLRSGLGLLATSRGECYKGTFRDDFMWGPGVFHFHSLEQASAEQPTRSLYRGMMNGQPRGRGILTWSDGKEVDSLAAPAVD
ncbi:hypothetical protein WJX72_010491 [[Myrmecia] bisecta]|uniref:MORN repeat-containing protein 4 n=1 Tax=[Myrmecia] bisecta TaxID=41462 RepID=A0AAW1QTI4_9CHLO